MRKFFWTCIVTLSILSTNLAGATVPENGQKEEDLFSAQAPLQVEMQADFMTMAKEKVIKGTPKKPFDGWIKVGDAVIGTTFYPRGGYRRFLCDEFPPFKIEIKEGQKKGPFRGLDADYKFVTHCRFNNPEEQQKVLAEYTVYRVLEAAGFSTFRVRLADVIYKDLADQELTRGIGFFIENKKDFASRKGLAPQTPSANLQELLLQLNVAERVVYNPDFGFHGNSPEIDQHNLEIIANEKKEFMAVVPYDFDLSNLVTSLGIDLKAETFLDYLKTTPEAVKYLKPLCGREGAVREEISNSIMSQDYKKLFQGYFDDLFRSVKEEGFLNCTP